LAAVANYRLLRLPKARATLVEILCGLEIAC
jgi:hypothetical protein